jgi:hypothetical protein
MFCRPCIVIYKYSETNVMHFLLSLLRIKDLYMFRALLAPPQEALNKRHLVLCIRVTLVGYTILVQPTDITHKQYIKCQLCNPSWGWASNARNIWRSLILNKLNKKCITLISLSWCMNTVDVMKLLSLFTLLPSHTPCLSHESNSGGSRSSFTMTSVRSFVDIVRC